MKNKFVIWLIDLFRIPLSLFIDPCKLDRAWLLQTFKGSACKPDFCDTPDLIIDEMIQAYKTATQRLPSHRMLKIVEPGFGAGAMLKKIDAAFRHSYIIAIEVDPKMFAQVYDGYKKNGALTRGNFINFHKANFFAWKQKDNDLVLMNPPYDNRRFINHIQHAVSITRPGGYVISLLPESVFHSISLRAIRFRRFLKKYHTSASPLGTKVCNYPVPVVMVKIHKP